MIAPAAGGAAGASAGALGVGGPLAGFEALLAALFGPTDAAAPVPAPGGEAGKAPAPAQGFLPATAALVAEPESETAEQAPVETDGAVADPAAVLAAAAATASAIPAPAEAPKSDHAPPPSESHAKTKVAPAHVPAGPPDGLAAAVEGAPTIEPDAPTRALEVETPPPAALKAETPAPRPPAAQAPVPPPTAGALPPKTPVEVETAPAPQATPPSPPAPPPPEMSRVATPAPAPAAKPPPQPARTAGTPRAERSADLAEPTAAKPAGPVRKLADAGPPEKAAAEPALAAGPAAAEPERADSAQAPAETRSASPTSAPQAQPHAPVRGAPETVANLAAQIVKKLEGRSTRFDVELDPVGLGKVDVRVEIGAHGRVSAAMTFESPHAATELKARAGELHRALEQAGFDLSGGLSFDVAGDRGHAQQGWSEQGQADGGFRGRAFQAALETAGEADTAASGALRLRRGVTGGVDVRI